MNEEYPAVIGRIDDGVVIDHITPHKVSKVQRILKVDQSNQVFFSADNLRSSYLREFGYESKGLLKIDGRSPTDFELNRIALVAPYATVSIIESGEVARKWQVRLPDTLEGLVPCPVANCISNQDYSGVGSIIRVVNETKAVGEERFSCAYCHHEFGRDALEDYL